MEICRRHGLSSDRHDLCAADLLYAEPYRPGKFFLWDSEEQRSGWHYEILVGDQAQEYEPRFSDLTLLLPEGTHAVRISRVLTEYLPLAQIEWSSLQGGTEAFLDGELLHSDFLENERSDAGFLASAWDELPRILENRKNDVVGKIVRISLPGDYVGKTLTLTVYFPETSEYRFMSYPLLFNDDSSVALMIVQETPPIAMLTICAFFALMTAGVFLMDVSNNKADWRILLLSLYFLLLLLKNAFNAAPGYYGILSSYIELNYTNLLYLSPLFLYLALRLTRWRKIVLGLWTALWSLHEVILTAAVQTAGLEKVSRSGLGAFLLFAAFAAAFGIEAFLSRKQSGKTRQDRKPLVRAAQAAVILVLLLFNTLKDLNFSESYLKELLRLTLAGNFDFPVGIIADTCAGMAMITLAADAIRRTLRTAAEVSVLKERSRQTLASYNQLLEANEAANSVRHEMHHHMTALSGILDSGDIERARRYAASVSSELDRLPVGRYSRNLLVNVIAGTYLNRAQAKGIRTEHHLDIPAELPAADEDLSVFLSNMLQNALEACERMEKGRERYISLYMRLRANFLFIKCVNSTDSANGALEESKEERIANGHGYGLAAMRRIAEKYGSILVISQLPGSFEIKSSLCLQKRPDPFQNTRDSLSS